MILWLSLLLHEYFLGIKRDTVPGVAALSKLFFSPLKRGSALKGKNLLPRGANSFLLE